MSIRDIVKSGGSLGCGVAKLIREQIERGRADNVAILKAARRRRYSGRFSGGGL